MRMNFRGKILVSYRGTRENSSTNDKWKENATYRLVWLTLKRNWRLWEKPQWFAVNHSGHK